MLTEPMLTATALALLVASTNPIQAQTGFSDAGPARLVQVDSAHTLFTPNAPDRSRAGQVFQLPQGGFGVSTGGTPYYQTLGTPNGSQVAIPSGNNTFSVLGAGGRAGTAHLRD
jgi:hypothetical protein